MQSEMKLSVRAPEVLLKYDYTNPDITSNQTVMHNTPIPLEGASTAHMAIMALLKIPNRSRSVGICENLRLLRFHYASSTLPVGFCYASYDAATV